MSFAFDGTVKRLTERIAALEAILGSGGPGSATSATVIATGSTTARNLGNRFADVVNVKDYGAVGDGVTDDTGAIQAAIDAAGGSGKRGTVLIPGPSSAVFVFTALTVKEGVHLVGGGGVLKLKDGTCVNGAASYYPISNLDGVGGGYANVTIEGLVVDGNKANNSSFAVADAITVSGENVKVLNNTISDPPDSGIMVSKTKNSAVTNNRISGGRDVGIYVNDGDGTGLYETVITHNRISGFPFGGIALKRIATRTTVALNTVYDCGNGITLEHASTSSDYSTDVTISLNRLRYIGYIEPTTSRVGINLRRSANVVCTGNRLEDVYGRAIYVEASADSVVAHNIITGSATQDATNGHGIEVVDRDSTGSSGMVFSGNVITGVLGSGIRLSNTVSSSGNKISGNVVTGVTGTALVVPSSWTGNIITENVLSGTAADLSYSATATANVLTDNRLINSTVLGGIVAAGQDYSPSGYEAGAAIVAGRGSANHVKIGNVGGAGVGFGSTVDSVLYRVSAGVLGMPSTTRLIAATVGADRGDTSQALTVGTDAREQRWDTALTANRTVTISSTGAVNGDWFRIVRTGLGAFTLTVQDATPTTIKAIPAGTAAYVLATFNGTAWRLSEYGTL